MAPLALPSAPAIAPPTVIPPRAATRPTVSPSSLTPPDQPRRNSPCDQILCEILTSLETIKQQQQMILLQLQNSYPRPVEVPEVSGFPLTSLNELMKLEESIAAVGEYRQKLVTYFGLAGGLTVKDSVWRIMSKLLTNPLAKQINWRGANGKFGFEQLAIKDVVLSKFYLCFIVLLNSHHYRKNIYTFMLRFR
uniref:DUF4806 domain-containing protein n=1 Tax=Sinocyclocheilus anshuiensis TaxID=1608454 RepID=A0A671RFG5_9TELE